MIMPESKESSGSFVTEFAKELTSYTQNNKYIQEKIKLASSSGSGVLTRFFDKMEFSNETANEVYKAVNDAQNKDQLSAYLQNIIIDTAKCLFNKTMTDLSDSVKNSLGDKDYNQLVSACNHDKNILIDSLLSGIVVLNAQIVTIGFNTQFEKNNKLDPVEFNEQISIPMNDFITLLNKKSLETTLITSMNNLQSTLPTLDLLLNEEMTKGSRNHQRRINEVQKEIKDSLHSIEVSLKSGSIFNIHDTLNKVVVAMEASVKKNIVNTNLKDKILTILSQVLTFGLYEYKSEKTQNREHVANQVVDAFKSQLHVLKQDILPIEDNKELEKESENTLHP